MPLGPDTLHRLLVCKYLLASREGRLTPQSHAVTVAQVILTAHDATELALAAIATAIGADVKDYATLMDYPASIAKTKGSAVDAFTGRGFLDQLNRVRRDFKHAGILPNVPQWHRVIEQATDWVNQWCTAYLAVDFSALHAGDLLTQEAVREFYKAAREAHAAGHYREALENVGRALLSVLESVPRIWFPVVGKPDPHRALLLTAFGVSASQLLTLEEFLPTVRREILTREIVVTWERRHGHPANWRRSHSKFCLDALIDVALKVEHAERLPMPIPFEMVYDDVISARDQVVALWHYDHSSGHLLTSIPKRGATVATLQPGQKLRCELSPSPYEIPLRPAVRNAVTISTAQVLEIRAAELPSGVAYVERELVEISFEPKADDLARRMLSEDC